MVLLPIGRTLNIARGVHNYLLAFIGHCVIYGVESWSGAMEWSFGVDCGVEWSQILSFCHPSRTGF